MRRYDAIIEETNYVRHRLSKLRWYRHVRRRQLLRSIYRCARCGNVWSEEVRYSVDLGGFIVCHPCYSGILSRRSTRHTYPLYQNGLYFCWVLMCDLKDHLAGRNHTPLWWKYRNTPVSAERKAMLAKRYELCDYRAKLLELAKDRVPAAATLVHAELARVWQE